MNESHVFVEQPLALTGAANNFIMIVQLLCGLNDIEFTIGITMENVPQNRISSKSGLRIALRPSEVVLLAYPNIKKKKFMQNTTSDGLSSILRPLYNRFFCQRGTLFRWTLKLTEVLNKPILSASGSEAAVLIGNSHSLE